MFKNILMAAVFALSGTIASAATYNPFGPQNDVLVSDVLTGGWTIIYQDTYNATGVDIADLFAGAGDMIMLASRQVGSATFDVLAAVDASLFVPLHTDLNETVLSNGARWYKNGFSMGFAGATDSITQSSADVAGRDERDRLSWHTNIGISGRSASQDALELSFGWRSGNNTGLNSTTAWERVVLTRLAPVPVPASLPLLVGAVGAIVLVRRRKRA